MEDFSSISERRCGSGRDELIKIIGLGCNDGDITLRGYEALGRCSFAIFKTALTDTYKLSGRINIKSVSLDSIYEESDDFDELDERLADAVIGYSNEYGDIAYLVNGSGIDDRSVVILSERCKDIEYYPSVARESGVMPPNTSYNAMSAYDIVGSKVFMPDTKYPLIIKEIDNKYIAGDIKLILTSLYGDEKEITVFENGKSKTIPLYELDQLDKYDYTTTVYVISESLTDKERFTFLDLMRIMYRLRDKETGCEWDKAQTHESIRKNVIEESYELVEAINNKDIENIEEESGDIMLQSVFHAVIGEETGEFDVNDMISALCHKLVTRHTHIFGDVVANTPEEALQAWEKAKEKEKNNKELSKKIEGIAGSLPAIMRAEKVQRIASKKNMDFASVEDAAEKVKEELQEVLRSSGNDAEMECGDLLFASLNVLRLMGIEGEVALQRSTDKFVSRLIRVEEAVKADGKTMEDMPDDELNEYWIRCKRDENR